MVRLGEKELVIADIPGLIEGAHLGKGLGDRFLAHVERCSVILHIVDASKDNPLQDYLTIRGELEKYNNTLYRKPEIIALNKSDLLESGRIEELKTKFATETNSDVYVMAAATNQGCREVINCAATFINKKEEW